MIINPENQKPTGAKNNDLFINEDHLIKDAAADEIKPVEQIPIEDEVKDAPSYSDQANRIWKLMEKIQSDDKPEEVEQAYVDP